MSRYWLRRAVITAVVFGGFGLYWVSIAFEWKTPLWMYPVGGVVALSVVSLVSFRPSRTSTSTELYASDVYSDAYLGRSQPVHPYREMKPSSEVGEALSADPIAVIIQRRPGGRK